LITCIKHICVSSLCWNLCPHEPGKINKGKKQMAAEFLLPSPENLFSGNKYSNFHLKFHTSIPLGYLPVCICTGFPSYIGYIFLSSTFASLVNYLSTKAVVYSDQHVKCYEIGQKRVYEKTDQSRSVYC
jgi:hypothetical protein